MLADRRAYRRGLVLGLTIGELFMLVAFLLALAIAWAEERQAAVRAEMERMEEVRDLAAEVGGSEALERLLAEREDWRSEAEQLRLELAELAPLRDALSSATPQDLSNAIELVRVIEQEPALRGAQVSHLVELASAMEGLSDAEMSHRLEAFEQLENLESLSSFSEEEIALLLKNADLLEAVRGIAADYAATNRAIASELDAAFSDRLADWNASFDAAGLVFRFEDPNTLFEQGDARLQPGFRQVLSEFCPRLFRILRESDEEIEEIRIEGHTSSEWRTGTSDRDAYFSNMWLSQGRTRAVLEYCLSLPEVEPLEDWVRAETVAVGMSSSRLVLTDGGEEDPARSRRVEFRIITDAAQSIEAIASEVGDE